MKSLQKELRKPSLKLGNGQQINGEGGEKGTNPTAHNGNGRLFSRQNRSNGKQDLKNNQKVKDWAFVNRRDSSK